MLMDPPCSFPGTFRLALLPDPDPAPTSRVDAARAGAFRSHFVARLHDALAIACWPGQILRTDDPPVARDGRAWLEYGLRSEETAAPADLLVLHALRVLALRPAARHGQAQWHAVTTLKVLGLRIGRGRHMVMVSGAHSMAGDALEVLGADLGERAAQQVLRTGALPVPSRSHRVCA